MLNRDVIWLGPVPAEEECAQVGEPSYRSRATAECLQFIKAIKRKCGEPPDGAELKMGSVPHQQGQCLEVVVELDPSDDEAVRYASHADANAPTRWDEVGLSAPMMNPGRGR